MSRNDETQNHKNGFLKKFGIGLVGGVFGGILAVGSFYNFSGTLFNNSGSGNQTTETTNSGSNTQTEVSNIKVNATSDVTEAVKKVQDAVVSVINLQSTQSNSLEDIFGNSGNGNDNTLQIASEGSGVIYKKDGKDAYVVTNNHVVEGQKGLEVMLQDGSKVQAELVGTDAFTDLAVLKISSENIKNVATFGDSESLNVGEPAIAIGSPLGSQYANSVTQGIISSLNRPVQSTNEAGELVSINAIQTDAAINPGNSGGALINIAGQVIGINSSKIASSAGSGVSVEGMGFAIPSNDVVHIISELEQHGEVIRPVLGVSMLDLTQVSVSQQQAILKVPADVTSGVVVADVQPVSAAEAAGIEQYDIIVEIAGEEVNNMVELRKVLYSLEVGSTVSISFYRDGELQTMDVTLTDGQAQL